MLGELKEDDLEALRLRKVKHKGEGSKKAYPRCCHRHRGQYSDTDKGREEEEGGEKEGKNERISRKWSVYSTAFKLYTLKIITKSCIVP